MASGPPLLPPEKPFNPFVFWWEWMLGRRGPPEYAGPVLRRLARPLLWMGPLAVIIVDDRLGDHSATSVAFWVAWIVLGISFGAGALNALLVWRGTASEEAETEAKRRRRALWAVLAALVWLAMTLSLIL